MGMYHGEGGLGGKAIEFGKLPIKHTSHHGEDGVQQSGIHVALHMIPSFICIPASWKNIR